MKRAKFVEQIATSLSAATLAALDAAAEAEAISRAAWVRREIERALAKGALNGRS
ncbi:hypothetical protein [Mesorhizobium sp. ORS 3428]|uniref:hypothetical protein n=1 Tax=Mesorhizobium sp. ORS 3428 TaxID=540997 RepID=UPI0012FF62CB|nr:hypothetical protein [Mesorhizobium sp. ORS 3428]